MVLLGAGDVIQNSRQDIPHLEFNKRLNLSGKRENCKYILLEL